MAELKNKNLSYGKWIRAGIRITYFPVHNWPNKTILTTLSKVNLLFCDSEKNEKAVVAKVFDSKILSEKLKTKNTDKGNAVNDNPGDKTAVIEKILETEPSGFSSAQAKEIVVSKYAVTPSGKINEKIFRADKR